MGCYKNAGLSWTFLDLLTPPVKRAIIVNRALRAYGPHLSWVYDFARAYITSSSTTARSTNTWPRISSLDLYNRFSLSLSLAHTEDNSNLVLVLPLSVLCSYKDDNLQYFLISCSKISKR